MTRQQILDQAIEDFAQSLATTLTNQERVVLERTHANPAEYVVTGTHIGALRQELRRRGLIHFGHANERGKAYVTLEPLGQRVFDILHPVATETP